MSAWISQSLSSLCTVDETLCSTGGSLVACLDAVSLLY